jgi:hypothetical protein
MQSNRARFGVLGVLVAAAVVLFVVLNGGSDSGTVTKGVQTITVKGNQPVGGVKKLVYKKGDTVQLVVHSDREGDVHVHGYNIEKPLKAGGELSLTFKANLEGDFEIEQHGKPDLQIADLKVEP